MQIQMLQFNSQLYPIRRDSGVKSNLSYTNLYPAENSLFRRTRSREIAFKGDDSLSLSTKPSNKQRLKFLQSRADYGDHPAEAYEKEIVATNCLPTFNNPHFEYKNYKNLSPKEQRIIRMLNRKGTFIEDTGRYEFNRNNHSIHRDAERILRVALTTKNKLDKEYTNGYKLVGIGRSPAAIVETMNLLGADAVAMPFSTGALRYTKKIYYLYGGSTDQYVDFTTQEWEDYFKYFGIDKDFSQRTGKTLIFTDYVCEGCTKYCLESILNNLGFDDKNTKFIDIMRLIPGKEILLPDDYISFGDCFDHRIFDVYSKIDRIASFINEINIIKSPELYKTLPETFMSKLFRCALYDLLEEKKLKNISLKL